jgi:hypothetical protein
VLLLEPYIFPVFFGLIFVSGVVGNGGLMFIICFYKSMRNLPNLFVFNLALGDLFVRPVHDFNLHVRFLAIWRVGASWFAKLPSLPRYSNILISMFFCSECVIDFSFPFHTYFLCISLFKRSFSLVEQDNF